MKSFEYEYYGNDIVAHNKTLCAQLPLALFDPDYLATDVSLEYKQQNTAHAKGRGRVHVFKYKNQNLILRHYYRGGLPAKFIRKSYLWKGLHHTRAIAELEMLYAMQAMGLPVPTPVGAHIHRFGMAYTADIITTFIAQSQTLSASLTKDPLATQVWRKIGGVIKQLHDKNCNHADLNAHNILLAEDGKIFVIDFDRSRIEKNSGKWKKNNLTRLQRSLLKLQNTQPQFNYSQENFQSLIEGYSYG